MQVQLLPIPPNERHRKNINTVAAKEVMADETFANERNQPPKG